MKMKKGDKVRFRVPGLVPRPGRSHGAVVGKIVALHTEPERLTGDDIVISLTVKCPLGEKFDLPVDLVYPLEKGGEG